MEDWGPRRIGTQGWGDGDKSQVVETGVWEMGTKEDANG